MLKVLFFIESLEGGGAEKVLIDLVNHMDQSKFSITVQTLWPSENRKKLASGIRYRCVYPKQNSLYCNLMRLESALGLTYSLHMKDDYDIEVAYLECGTTKILSSSTNRHAAKIAWVHCDLSIKMENVLDSFIQKAAPQYRRYDRIACVSQDVLAGYQRLFGSTPPASVVHNTIDDSMIREKAQQALPSEIEKRGLTLVSLGRLTSQKGYDRLLRVHLHLLQDGFVHQLWILGDGEERPSLERFIADKHLERSVFLCGFQDNPYPFIQAADLLVCSSRYEGFSTFVTEGLILGKPIVTTDCTGMRELLGDSEFGLITENSENGLYAGLKSLLSNPDRLQLYAQSSKLRSSDFNTKALVKKTEAFIEASLQENLSKQK